MNNGDVDKAIEGLDLGLFSKIESQTTDEDRTMLLAVERVVRRTGEYTYLEIGSYLGGTLQPHVLDNKCTKIFSIDNRPVITDDVRGEQQIYQNNSTEHMLELLSTVSGVGIAKIVTFETDASEIDAALIDPKPDICFIDGEHTDRAAFEDFQFCLKIASADCAIAFHDSNLVFGGIRKVVEYLNRTKTEHTAMKLAGSVFVIALGRSPVVKDKYLNSMRQNLSLFFLKSTLLLWDRKRRIRRSLKRRSKEG